MNSLFFICIWNRLVTILQLKLSEVNPLLNKALLRCFVGIALYMAIKSKSRRSHHLRGERYDVRCKMYDVRVAMIHKMGVRTRRIERGIRAC